MAPIIAVTDRRQLVKVSVDSAGRMVIPKPVRDRLGMSGRVGTLELLETADGVVIRNAVAAEPALDTRGLLVVDIRRPLGAEEVDTAVEESRRRIAE